VGPFIRLRRRVLLLQTPELTKDEKRHDRVSGPVRESDIRSTCLHGFEEPQVLNTEGERYMERRKGVPIVEKGGQKGRMEGKERVEQITGKCRE
jgi:hypothetical protein